MGRQNSNSQPAQSLATLGAICFFMLRLWLIFAIIIVSCNHSEVKEHKIVEVTVDTIQTYIDSSSRIWDAFNWRKWEKPTGGRYIHLSDDMLKYVTKGHIAIDASYGDVNDDGELDLITITAPANEDSVLSNNGDLSRDLLIFFRQNDNSLSLALKSTKAVPRFNWCDSTDSFAGHTALTGRLTINKSCSNETLTRSEYRFRYETKLKDWLLDTIVIESFPSNTENFILDTLTKKDFGIISLKTFDIHKVR